MVESLKATIEVDFDGLCQRAARAPRLGAATLKLTAHGNRHELPHRRQSHANPHPARYRTRTHRPAPQRVFVYDGYLNILNEASDEL